MDFELTWLVLLSIFFVFEPKIASSIYGFEETYSYQLAVQWTMQGLTEQSFLFNIIGCCNFTEAKSCEVCTVLLDKGPFLKN